MVFYVERGKKEYRTKRWLQRPVLEIKGSEKEPELAAFTRGLFNSIFAAAGDGLPQGTKPLTVYLGTARDLVPIRQKLIANQPPADAWTYNLWWAPDQREITNGVIFILTDRLDDKEARRALVKSLMGSAGFPDESREYRDSVLYPESKATELSPADQALIKLLYRTTPGLGREALLKEITAHWGE